MEYPSTLLVVDNAAKENWGDWNTKQTHYKGVTLHLCTRIIGWSLAPVEIDVN
jgi:hypothetical protein